MKSTTITVAIILLLGLNAQTALTAEQRIQPGNMLNITVLGYPELSKTVLVRQDGTTEYPLLYNIPVDGMSVVELRELLLPILTRFVERPYVFINIAQYLQFLVTVQGQVVHPGSFEVQGPIDLQGVLSVAGGPTGNADLSRISILRRQGEKRQEITVDLYLFLRDRSKAPLPYVESDDIIYVPSITSNTTVRVMGAVADPGSYLAVKDENLADMIYMAGGPMDKGNMNRVVHISYVDGRYHTEVIKLKKLIDTGRNDLIPLVHAGDVIFVKSHSPWRQLSFWATLVRDTAMLASTIVLIGRI